MLEPPSAAALRPVLAPDGQALVGAVGPLLVSRGAEVLRAVGGISGTRLVVVGDGPLRDRLALHLPDALFLGALPAGPRRDVVAALDVAVVADPAAQDEDLGEVLSGCRRVVVVRDLGTPLPRSLLGAAGPVRTPARGDAPVRVVPTGAWGDLRAAVRLAVTAARAD